MKKRFPFCFSFLIFTFSFFVSTGTVFAQEEEILLSKNAAAETENETSQEDVYTVKKEWFIYYKKAEKVTAGPFDTVEEAISAWIDNPKIKPKGKYYIGRNGRMYTNDPENYYKKKFESVVHSKALIAAQEQREQKAREEAELAAMLNPEPTEVSEPVEEENLSQEKTLSKKELRAKEKAEKKAEKERIAAEKKAEKERKKNGITEEMLQETDSAEETAAVQETSNEPETEAFVFTPDSASADDSEIPGFIAEKDLFSGNRYSKTYLSDYIAKDIFTIPENTESDLESEFKDFSDEPDAKGVTALMKAVREGNDWKIRTLISAGSDVNAKDKDGWTPLMYAVRYQNNVSVVNQLLSQKADVKAQNNFSLSALVLASCFNDNPDIIKKLLSYYSPSDKEVQKAFVQLISTQQTDNFALISKIKLFLDFGLPVNSYYDGKTPLMYTCKYCTSTKAVKLLLDKNATITVRSTEGKTAFDYAQENKALPRDEIYWSLNKR
ncbi:MAG: ankyrin repeat domain-containing protein [Treponema sp.]|nr:ankyrin repeat domain-containing protein [Treponema sp.]